MEPLALRGREVHLQEAIRLGRQELNRRVYSKDSLEWRKEFAEGKHRYTKGPETA